MELTRRRFIELGSLILGGTLANTSCSVPNAPQHEPEFKIEEMVQEGYKSLASRTSELYQTVKPNLKIEHRFIPALSQFEADLRNVISSGKISSIDSKGAQNLSDIIDICEYSIPSGFMPHSAGISMGAAVYSARSYFGLIAEELFKKASIDNVLPTSGNPGILFAQDAGGKKIKIFHYVFDPVRPAHSVIVNIHELQHALQPETQAIYRIVDELDMDNRFSKLSGAILSDPKLRELNLESMGNSHKLRLYSRPEVIKKAEELKIDVTALKSYIRDNTPVMDFLTAYTEGDAHLMQSEIVAANPDLKKDNQVLEMYRLIGLTDALRAPFGDSKPRFNDVGVGLAEYFRLHPEQKSLLMNSAKFHQELSRKYFSNAR